MILLDTHIWHWWINQIPDKLPPNLRILIEEAAEVGVSSISCFEMAWLVKHGRICLPMSFNEWLSQVEEAAIIRFLPVIPIIAANAVVLPEHHRDPMDRLIISTTLYYDAQFRHDFSALSRRWLAFDFLKPWDLDLTTILERCVGRALRRGFRIVGISSCRV